MRRILFIVPDSTGIRNYLYSDILKYLKYKSKIHIWSPLNEQCFNEVFNIHNIEIKYTKIRFLRENYLGRWLRETVTYSRLKRNSSLVRNKSIMLFWNYKPIGILKLLFSFTNILCGSAIAWNYNLILKVEILSKKLWSKNKIQYFESFLKKDEIDVLFITHQRAVGVMPVCLAAKNLGIRVITVIYSWDNIPKARLNIFADKYLVWSDYMKNEMQTYYPEIDPFKVVVTGTPQFEFYNKKDLFVDRMQFALEYGLDPSKYWILYSGGDILTSPLDQYYLDDLVEALKIDNRIHLILRKSPADLYSRFDSVVKNHKSKITVIDPLWIKGDTWSSNIPLYDDFKLLYNLIYHTELSVNVGSTIAHDCANFNKPAIYINYDCVLSSGWSIKRINEFQHFRSMPSKDSVVWINSKDEWLSKINMTIKAPLEIAKDRLNWFHIVNKSDGNLASKEIAKLLF